jgi:hypothetical protein
MSGCQKPPFLDVLRINGSMLFHKIHNVFVYPEHPDGTHSALAAHFGLELLIKPHQVGVACFCQALAAGREKPVFDPAQVEEELMV